MAEVAGTPRTVPEVGGALDARSDNVFVVADSEATEVKGNLLVVLGLVLRFTLGLGLDAMTLDSRYFQIRPPSRRLTIIVVIVRSRGRWYPCAV